MHLATQNGRKFYVYVHRKADSGEVFYVGKGARDRISRLDSRSEHWLNIVSRHGFIGEKIKSGLPEACAFSLERMVIAKYGRDALCNKTDGGAGSVGFKHSEGTVERISALKKGIRHKLSDEARAARSEKIRAAKLGVKLSESHRASLRASHLGKTLPHSQRRKIAAANTGENHPRHDRALYQLVRDDGVEITLSRYEIMSNLGVSRSMVSLFINGKVKTCKGWSIKTW